MKTARSRASSRINYVSLLCQTTACVAIVFWFVFAPASLAQDAAAKEAGLKLCVNSDGHQVRALGYVEFGIGQARRGWLAKSDVVNTHTWKQIEKLRRRRP